MFFSSLFLSNYCDAVVWTLPVHNVACVCLLLMTGPVAMDSPSRGILKNGGGRGEGGNNGDDSYLFCNVPEHHDLVSFITMQHNF